MFSKAADMADTLPNAKQETEEEVEGFPLDHNMFDLLEEDDIDDHDAGLPEAEHAIDNGRVCMAVPWSLACNCQLKSFKASICLSLLCCSLHRKLSVHEA